MALRAAILCALLVAACSGDPSGGSTGPPGGLGHTDFTRAFTEGARFWDPEDRKTYEIDVLEVGHLALPTGSMIVHDPLTLHPKLKPAPLRGSAPRGRWPAELSIAREVTPGGLGSGVVASARVRFSQAPAVKWSAAAEEDGEPFHFGVDAGRIAVFDRAALERAPSYEAVTAAAEKVAMDRTGEVLRLPGGGHMLVSDAGYGDGAYPAWWGMDQSGAKVELVVEFDVLVRNRWSEVDVPMGLLRKPGRVMTPSLSRAGVSLEVVPPDDLPSVGRRSAAPARPPVGLAVRTRGRRSAGSELMLVNSSGQPVGLNPGLIHPESRDFEELHYWADDPRLKQASVLRIRVFEGLEPLGPPPQ